MIYTENQLIDLLLPMLTTLQKDKDPKAPGKVAKVIMDAWKADREAFKQDAPGDTSDGYHTFRDLYEHRMALTLCLMKSNPEISWVSKNHHPDGDPMFEGFFIVGLNLPTGVITYHYKLEHWDTFDVGIKELDHAPLWDGHTPEDVVERLIAWGSR